MIDKFNKSKGREFLTSIPKRKKKKLLTLERQLIYVSNKFRQHHAQLLSAMCTDCVYSFWQIITRYAWVSSATWFIGKCVMSRRSSCTASSWPSTSIFVWRSATAGPSETSSVLSTLAWGTSWPGVANSTSKFVNNNNLIIYVKKRRVSQQTNVLSYLHSTDSPLNNNNKPPSIGRVIMMASQVRQMWAQLMTSSSWWHWHKMTPLCVYPSFSASLKPMTQIPLLLFCSSTTFTGACNHGNQFCVSSSTS